MEQVLILLVGVDIGALTSGISCSLLGPGATNLRQPESIRLQGLNHLEPTELGVGEASETYGSGIAAGEDKFTLLKLLMLDPEELRDADHPQGYEVIQQAVDKTKTRYTGVEAVAEYIKRLWADASQGVKAYLALAGQLQPEDVETRFVFGVPAVWKPEATEKMRLAIARSGILAFGRSLAADLRFVDEPVAAAMAVIPNMARLGRVEVGNTILVLDCGGATVDAAAYTLESFSPTSSQNLVELRQCVDAEGRFLGAIHMKSAFASFVKERVEKETGDGYALVDQIALDSKIEQMWTNIKEEPVEFWTVDGPFEFLSVQRTNLVATQPMELKMGDLRKVLRPVAKEIAGFAAEQGEAAGPVARIVVVGGFGRNALVQAELKLRFKEKVEFTDHDGEVAVKNGACWEGIRLTQVEANPGGGNALEINKQEPLPAPASFGYCPDHTSPKIEWFISKGKLISKFKSSPTFFPFPPASAFKRARGQLSLTMPIYRTTPLMDELVSYQADDSRVKPFRVVECGDPNALEDGSPRELGVYFPNTVEFGVFVAQRSCAHKQFKVKHIQ